MLPRFRRYRVFIVLTVVILFGLYYLDGGHSILATSRRRKPETQHQNPIPPTIVAKKPARNPPKRTRRPKRPESGLVKEAVKAGAQSGFPQIALPGDEDTGETKESLTPAKKPPKLPVHPSNGYTKAIVPSFQPGKHKADQLVGTLLKERVHWVKQPEHFPIPTASIIPLPSTKPETVPRIQASFHTDLIINRRIREKKLNAIKGTFQKHWNSYRDRAWEHDELKPVSGDFRDPYAGWCATLVDSLDTLWIMGLKDEFEEAVLAVKSIDFKTTLRVALPMFEVIIRYLGGLLGAYDVSGQKYDTLLSKAVELAEVLMPAFDTPNRLPKLPYRWQPSEAKERKAAAELITLSELGSLSLEFTRLAQLTQEAKYYDAVARITNELEVWQDNTKVPGLWPLKIDASGGCSFDELRQGHSRSKGPSLGAADHDSSLLKRQAMDDCITRGLSSHRGERGIDIFTVAGGADSTYEYLPKEYLLLGGSSKQYERMHEGSVQALIKHLLYRPMIEDEERKPLFTGEFSTAGIRDKESDKLQGTWTSKTGHLSCFVGAWIGLGAKVFSRKEDMNIAARLTDGCVWAYEQTATGIMPETFDLVPCPNLHDSCPWNETRWWEAIDPMGREKAKMNLEQLEDVQATSRDKVAGDGHSGRSSKPAAAPDRLDKRQLDETGSSGIEHDDQAREGTKPGTASTRKVTEEAFKAHNDLKDIDARGKQKAMDAKATHDFPVAKAKSKDRSARFEDEERTTDRAKAKATLDKTTTDSIPLTYEELMEARISADRLKPGISQISQREYMLHPEAIESVFYMWRITADHQWREKGWNMFQAIDTATESQYGNSAIWDVTDDEPRLRDNAESYWTGETLKYFYLLFSDPDLISLDDYVLNTEGHPFQRPDAKNIKLKKNFADAQGEDDDETEE